MVGVDAVHTGEEMPMDCDFNDSDCEDPRDLAYEDWVNWYNFNAPEGYCVDLPDKEKVRISNAIDTTVMMVGEVAEPAHVQQDLLETSLPVTDIAIAVPVGDIPMAGHDAPIMTEFRDPRNDF